MYSQIKINDEEATEEERLNNIRKKTSAKHG
jgi:hypothetical protein